MALVEFYIKDTVMVVHWMILESVRGLEKLVVKTLIASEKH